MFGIIRCEMCGRVFPHYRGGRFTQCVNKIHCGASIPFDNTTVLPISYDISKIDQHEILTARKNKSLPAYINRAIVFINAFNNNVFLAAQVYSEDGLNSITISLNEKMLGVTREDVFRCVPEDDRYQLSRDGAYCFSGKYPLTQEIKNKINSCLMMVVNPEEQKTTQEKPRAEIQDSFDVRTNPG
jgi:hypothetical protein